MSDTEILSAELAEEWVEANNRRTALDFLLDTKVMAVSLVLIFVSSTVLYFMLDEENVDYGASMEFDQDRVRGYAQDLVDLGHPEWQGRMSGSAEEQASGHHTRNSRISARSFDHGPRPVRME